MACDEELMQVVCSDDSEADKLEKLTELAKNGANINYKDCGRDNSTPLHVAVDKQEINVVKFLVEHKGNVHAKNDQGVTPLELAQSLNLQNIVEVLTEVDRVCEKLELFVKYLVTIYLKKVSDYSAEVRAGVRTEKAGIVADNLTNVLEAVPEGGKPAGVVVNFVTSCWGKRRHRDKAQKVCTAFISFYDNTEALTLILVQAAFNLFLSFENQFTSVTALNGTWQTGIDKLANDAVNRSINYVANVKKGMGDVSSSMITEGVLSGKSKGWRIKFLTKPGHTLLVHQSGKKWNTSELFEGTGLLKVGDSLIEHHCLKRGCRANKYGYRLFLNWEEETWDDQLKHLYELNGGLQPGPYRYIVRSLDCQQKVAEILESLNWNDPQRVGQTTGEGVARIEDQLHDVADGITRVLDHVVANAPQPTKMKVWFHVRRPLIQFTGRLDILDEIDAGLRDGMVVVCGLGGVGKSSLVNEYIHARCNCQEDSVIWINAESLETAKNSFFWLAERLNLKMSAEDMEFKILKSLVDHVCSHVGGSRRILVLDNVENFATAEKLVPFGWPTATDQILITSPINNWNSSRLIINMVLLGDFSDADAIDFVKKGLAIENDDLNGDVITLVKMLYNFPLALQQAITYIKNTNLEFRKRKSQFTISDYMEEFKREPEKLLSMALSPDAHVETIYKTVEVTINKVIDDVEYGKHAMTMMNILAFLAPNNIPESMFCEELAGGDKKKLMAITGLLESYSIVSFEDSPSSKDGLSQNVLEDGMISINGLVQQVVRLKLEEPGEQKDILAMALSLLKGRMVDLCSLVGYISHILTVWDYACRFDDLIFQFINSDMESGKHYTTFIHLIAEGSPYSVLQSVVENIRARWPKQLERIVNLKTKDSKLPLHDAALSGDSFKVNLLLDVCSADHHPLDGRPDLATIVDSLKSRSSLEDWDTDSENLVGASSINKSLMRINAKDTHIIEIDHCFGIVTDGSDTRGINILTRNKVKNPTIFNPAPNGRQIWRNKNKMRRSKLPDMGSLGQVVGESPVNARTNFGFTPLHFAAQGGHLEMAYCLMDRDALVNAKDKDHFTPLHLACLHGHTEFVRQLVANPAVQVDAVTVKGDTALHLAVRNLEIVKLLLARGARVDVKNGEKMTVMDLANQANQLDVVEYLAVKQRVANDCVGNVSFQKEPIPVPSMRKRNRFSFPFLRKGGKGT